MGHAPCMVEEVHWAVRVIALFWSALVTGHTPPPSAQATAPPPPAECTGPTECTVVRDSCGRPYGRPLTNPVAPPGPQHCPPANYAVTEPACGLGGCEAVVASTPALRSCSQDSECVAMEWVCQGWWAVARSEQRGAQQHVNQAARTRSCRARSPSPEPPVACLEHICVVRAQGTP